MNSIRIRIAAVVLAGVYLVLLCATWVVNAAVPDWGIVRAARWLGSSSQLTILEVAPGGPADRAGLEPGDVVLAIEGQAITDESLWKWRQSRRQGDVVSLQVSSARDSSRGGENRIQDKSLRLEPRFTMPAFVVTLSMYSLIGLLALSLSLLVLVLRPADWAAQLLAVGMGAYAIALLVDSWQQQFYQLWLTQLFLYLFLFGSAALLHLFLIFPIESPALARLAYIGPTPLRRFNVFILFYATPLFLSFWWSRGPLVPVVPSMLLAFALLAGAVATLLRNYGRTGTPVQQAQLKWITFGLASGVLSTAVTTVALFTPSLQVTITFAASLWVLFPISVSIAILRHRLWNIDVIIRRTLIYGALSALLILNYLGSVLLLEEGFQLLTGQRRSEMVTVITTLAIAVSFRPLQSRIQKAIDRRFYRRKYDAAQVIAAFGATLRDEVDLDKLEKQLLAVVAETMEPEQLYLWLVHKPGTRTLDSSSH